MNYRVAKVEDTAQILALCSEHKIEPPSGKIFVAEQEGRIIGICAAKMQAIIEPLISENPAASAKLVSMAEGLLIGTGNKSVMVLTDKYENLFTKYGFIKLDKTVMEKYYDG